MCQINAESTIKEQTESERKRKWVEWNVKRSVKEIRVFMTVTFQLSLFSGSLACSDIVCLPMLFSLAVSYCGNCFPGHLMMRARNPTRWNLFAFPLLEHPYTASVKNLHRLVKNVPQTEEMSLTLFFYEEQWSTNGGFSSFRVLKAEISIMSQTVLQPEIFF